LPFRSEINGYRSPEKHFWFPHARNLYEFGFIYNAMMHYGEGIHWIMTGVAGMVFCHLRDGNLYNDKLGMPYIVMTTSTRQPFKTFWKSGAYEDVSSL